MSKHRVTRIPSVTQSNRRMAVQVVAINARAMIERSANSQRAFLLSLVDGVSASVRPLRYGRTPRIRSSEARTMRRLVAFAVREAVTA